jgi:adenylate cyclase
MFADLVGYSTMVEEDEKRTIEAVSTINRTIVLPTLQRHGGRLIRTMGDGFFAEFATATGAVQCGIEIHRAMRARNASPQLAFRIGINLGEMLAEGGDLYGRNVNVAARLETLAEPEGICLSHAVYEAVLGTLDARFEDGGTCMLRNINRPIHVWRWNHEDRTWGAIAPSTGPLELPSRPSLAVLPFTNMTGDRDQDYFADGLVDEIITALAKMRWFFVIARNSSFTYKGRSVDIRQVSRELGVRYVLEGSVRKAGAHVRITAQLIDGTTGNHLWAESLTCEIDQIFEIQDSIASSVAGAIEPKLRTAEIERARRKPTANLDAYDCYLRAQPYLVSGSGADIGAALELLERAADLDPSYALAQVAIAYCRQRQFLIGTVPVSPAFFAGAAALARRAVEIDPTNPEVLSTAAIVITLMGKDYTAGLEWIDAATRFNPNSSLGWARSGFIRCWVSEFSTGIEYFLRAMRLSPADPMTYTFQTGLGMAHMFLHDWPEALKWLRRAVATNRYDAPGYRFLAVTLVQCGEIEAARHVIRDLLAIDPLSSVSRSQVLTGYRDPEPRRLYIESLRQAGLPE